MGNIFSGGQGKREPGKTLEENSVDLTALAREGKLDPVIGRADETKRMVEILSRRTKCVAETLSASSMASVADLLPAQEQPAAHRTGGSRQDGRCRGSSVSVFRFLRWLQRQARRLAFPRY